MSERSTARNRFGATPASDRAMVPLALIGALVLLSSVLLVGYAQTGDEPDTAVDASIALDRTEATMQTVVRDATERATRQAATEPMTDPADTEWGAVLENAGPGLSADPFENYLRGLVYLEVKDDLALAEQREGDVETNVTVPAVTTPAEFGDAIGRVELEENSGEVTVSLSNVTITATDGKERLEHRETTVEVTVVTPVLDLHERVSEYQDALDEAGVTERGFTQRFNARTYAISWARGWAQNARAPVGEVLATRHIEPAANAARYRTQQDIFGAADPSLRNAVRLGWLCMALQDGKAMFDEYVGDRGGLSYEGIEYDPAAGTLSYNDTHAVDVPGGADVCNSAQFLLDGATGHPEPPDIVEPVGGLDRLQETETQSVGELAHYPLVELVDERSEHSVGNITQRVFTIEGYAATETESSGDLSLTLGCESGYVEGETSRDGTYSVRTTERSSVQDDDERYYVYDSEIDVTVTATQRCHQQDGNRTKTVQDSDSYTIELTTTVGEAEAAPNATVDELNPASEVAADHKYTPGPDHWGPEPFNNYDGAGEQVTAAILGGTDTESHESWIDDRMSETDYERGPPGSDQFETTELVELDGEALPDDGALTAELIETVGELRNRAANVTVEFERQELITGNPAGQLLDELERELVTEQIDEPEGYRYESVGEKLRYETRHAYYLLLVERLTRLEAAHESATDQLEGQVTDAAAIDDVTRYLTQGLRQTEPDPGTIASSELTGDVLYEVSGSPTYLLSSETVDSERVPAVDRDVEFAPLRTKNENAVDLPYEDVISGIVSTVREVVPGVSASPDAELTLRMAGDVLSAGQLAIDAHERADAADREDTYLRGETGFEDDLETFEQHVEDGLETFGHRVARQTAADLYPSPAAECHLYPRLHESHPGQERCHELTQEDDELAEVVVDAAGAIEDGVAETLAPYETAEAARLVGHGNATELIVDNVTRELDESEYRTEKSPGGHDAERWDDLLEAALRPAVAAASTSSVTVGSAEQAEALDETLQTALGNATATAVEDRMADAGEAIGETIGERWLGNTDGTRQRAARVPAGVPLVPLPGQWVATANAWTVEVAGEYARFEASATLGTPADGTQLTYVRENRTVDHEIAGAKRTLGGVEQIAFDSRSAVVVVTPPGVGVGDRDDENPECSPTYPHVGEVDPDRDDHCSAFDDD